MFARMLKPGLFSRQLPVVWLKLREAASAETILGVHSTIMSREGGIFVRPFLRNRSAT